MASLTPTACLVLAGVLHAQDIYLENWKQTGALQPQAVKLEISTVKRVFFMGEMIPLRLAFTASGPDSYYTETMTGDRSYRLDWAEAFVVDPVEAAEDPLEGKLVGSLGGLSGGPELLSTKPFLLERVLNEWVRFRMPGTYRVYVLSHRVWSSEKLEQAGHGQWGAVLVSNILTLEVRPTPPEWAAEQLAAAVKTLNAPISHRGEDRENRIRAGNILRFLDTRQAAAELVKRWPQARSDPYNLPPEARALQVGLLSSPYIDAEGRLKP